MRWGRVESALRPHHPLTSIPYLCFSFFLFLTSSSFSASSPQLDPAQLVGDEFRRRRNDSSAVWDQCGKEGGEGEGRGERNGVE